MAKHRLDNVSHILLTPYVDFVPNKYFHMLAVNKVIANILLKKIPNFGTFAPLWGFDYFVGVKCKNLFAINLGGIFSTYF